MRVLISLFFFFFLSSNALAVETIELTQTSCQFVEPEHGAQHFKADTYEACETLNEKSSESRLKKAKTITLKPGEYVFRVHNLNVPYTLGFWLRGAGFGRVTLPSVSGGGIETGTFKEYKISLKAGEYRYSCPLNPTPDYTLLVQP